jgi:hypothetical protein
MTHQIASHSQPLGGIVQNWIYGLLQGIFGSALYELLFAGAVAALLAYLRARRVDWAAPVLYGVCGFTAALVVAFAFTGHPLLSREQPQSTTENIEANVRTWSDAFSFGTQKAPDATMFFQFAVKLINGRTVMVGRPKEHEHYLEFRATISLPDKDQTILNKFTEQQQFEIFEQVRLELARIKVGGIAIRNSPLYVVIIKRIPITSDLNEYQFETALEEVNSALEIVDMSVSLAMQQNITHPNPNPQR